MVYLDGDIDENHEINLNDLVHLESYAQKTDGYSINENKIYNIATKNQDFDSVNEEYPYICLLYTSPSPRDATLSRMPSSA